MISGLQNRALLFVAAHRWMKRLVPPGIPRIARLPFPDGSFLALDAFDKRGPSFHLAHGKSGAEAAFQSYEPDQRKMVESYLLALKQEAPVFLDIGANIGLFSVSAKRALSGLKVYAFEPHPVTSACLRETAGQFRDFSVETIALSDANGEGEFFLDESDSGGHSLLANNMWNNRGRTVALKVTLRRLDDWFTETRLDFVKMDVQGAEDAVLRGGLRTLAKFRPGLLVEVQHENVFKEEAVIAELKKLPFSYRVRSMQGEEGSYEDLKKWSEREFARGVLFADYLFTP
jgi:FkbM family methyltransferase